MCFIADGCKVIMSVKLLSQYDNIENLIDLKYIQNIHIFR